MKSFQAQTHYEVLEISVGASPAEVRNAYERLSHLYSDDQVVLYGLVNPSQAVALRSRLKEALEVLSDDQRRESYDVKIGLPPRVVAPKAKPVPKPSAPQRQAAGASAGTGWGTFAWVTPGGPAQTPTQPASYTYAVTPTVTKPIAAPPPVMVVPVPARVLAVPPTPPPPPAKVEPPAAPPVEAPVVAPPAESPPESRQLSLDVPSGVTGWGLKPIPEPAVEPQAPVPAPSAPVAVAPSAPVPMAAPVPAPNAPVAGTAPVPAPNAPAPVATAPVPAPSAPMPVVAVAAEPTAPVSDASPAAVAPMTAAPGPAHAAEPAPVAAEAAPQPPPVEEPAVPILADDAQVSIIPARATPSREFRVEQRPRPYEIPEGVEINGDLLKQVRMAKGLSLIQVAERTRIGVKHLENVEGDRYDALPAAVYLRGILMNLARELGLDGLRVSKSYLTFVEAHRSKG